MRFPDIRQPQGQEEVGGTKHYGRPRQDTA